MNRCSTSQTRQGVTDGIPVDVSVVRIFLVYLQGWQAILPYCSAQFLDFENLTATKRSISSSFFFKLRRHKACTEAEGYDRGSQHERSRSNGQRQGKNDHDMDTNANYFVRSNQQNRALNLYVQPPYGYAFVIFVNIYL